MDVKFVCKKCGQAIETDAACAGQLVPCPNCKASLAVPKKIRVSASVPSPQPPAPQPPAPAQKGSRPWLKIAATLFVSAVLLGDYWGYTFWQARKKAKADAQLTAATASRDEKKVEQARIDAQLAAVQAALDAITSEAARVETQLTAVRATLDATTAKVANVETQLASVKTALDDKPAKNDGPQPQTPYSPPKKKKKKKQS